MSAIVTHETLHRTAKYFMDSGRAVSHEHAMNMLHGFGLNVVVGPEVLTSRDHQIALLTLVNTARRTLLGGVNVRGLTDAELLTPLVEGPSLKAAVTTLGGTAGSQYHDGWPLAVIGHADIPSWSSGCWYVTWDGWRGGVVPACDGRRLRERPSGGLAPALAAAIAASEAFTFHAGDHPLAGRRSAGLSLWSPGRDWISDDETEPCFAFLPSRLWLIGLGNLGQAYLWLLGCLSYANPTGLELVLQDHDRLAQSNESTSVLTTPQIIGRMKTRAMADWADRIGFRTMIEERSFGKWTRRADTEPSVALCGVDNALARSSLEDAGFGLVVETGLGAGPQAFRNFFLHTFPSSLSATQMWAGGIAPLNAETAKLPAYQSLKRAGLDSCGLAQLASRTVGVPFVGLTAAALAISELLRRLHGGSALELASGSLAAIEDIEVSAMSCNVYEFGHVPAAEVS